VLILSLVAKVANLVVIRRCNEFVLRTATAVCRDKVKVLVYRGASVVSFFHVFQFFLIQLKVVAKEANPLG
jgi:hypothetical protein